MNFFTKMVLNEIYVNYITRLSEESETMVDELKFNSKLIKVFEKDYIEYLFVNFVEHDFYKKIKNQFLDIIILDLDEEKADILSEFINLSKIKFNFVKDKENYRLYFKHCDLDQVLSLIYLIREKDLKLK